MSKYDLSAPLIQWRKKGKFRKILGHTIFTIDEGVSDDATILLIHGFPTSSWDWQPMWDGLRQNHRVVCLDLLGFGLSDKPDRRNYTIHAQADLVEALVHQLRLNNIHVLAHDYGDTVAQELLARQIEGRGQGRWLSCCFLNGGLFPETHRALLIQKIMLSPLGKYLTRVLGFKQFCKSFSKVFGPSSKPTLEELQQWWELINYKGGQHVFHNLITYINDRRKYRSRWVAALKKSRIPLGLINGSADPVSGKQMVARYKALECRLDYELNLKTIGHYPQIETPGQVLTAYLEFLSTSGSS
jgi:pimeloyl-ACP methyl ester carboxylesterase